MEQKTRRSISYLKAKSYKLKAGFSLIEVVVGISLITLSLVGLTGAYSFYIKAGLQNTATLQSSFLLQEGVEAVTLLRDDAWSNISELTPGIFYYLAWGGSTWEATTTPIVIDSQFTRTFKLDDVYRRTSDMDIVDEGSGDPKALDSNTKKLTVRITSGSVSTTTIAFTEGVTDSSLGSFPSNNAGDGDVAQSFTTGVASTTASQVDLFLKRVGDSSDVFLEIRSGSTVGTVLASSAVVVSSTISSSALTFVPFTFSIAPVLTPNTVYYLRLRSIPDSTEVFSGSSGTLNWGYKQTASSPYTGGVASRYVGRQGNQNDEGQELSQYDFSFAVSEVGGGLDKQVVTYLTNLFE